MEVGQGDLLGRREDTTGHLVIHTISRAGQSLKHVNVTRLHFAFPLPDFHTMHIITGILELKYFSPFEWIKGSSHAACPPSKRLYSRPCLYNLFFHQQGARFPLLLKEGYHQKWQESRRRLVHLRSGCKVPFFLVSLLEYLI